MTERKGREAWPPELTELLRKVDRLRRSGRYDEALSRMRQLVDAYPQQARVLLEMGLTLGIWGRSPAEALPWFERVLEMAPGHASAQFHRALSLARLGRHAEAVADFDSLEAVGFRKALVLHMKRAESLEVLGRLADAERDWTLALDEDPGNPWLLHQRASVRARLGRLEEAVKDLTEALVSRDGEPVDAELLRDRGVLRERLGDTAGARADFEAGLSALREGDSHGLAEDLRRRLQQPP
ncbi:tetratricopeptide repeat protein [Archangium violaceum]|uniref:tetratricopeptide repeat protein n=1 Tax=Archangium violaceum TaxID=83451 RepID=UPI002B2A1C02|nr:tetratricopeptide repeat protein [Archangium violaceum]